MSTEDFKFKPSTLRFFGTSKTAPYLGVELELTPPDLVDDDDNYDDYKPCLDTFNELVDSKLKPFRKYIHDVYDDGGGVEVNLYPIQLNYWQSEQCQTEFKALFKLLNKAGYDGDTDDDGMHIHIDRAAFTYEEFKKLIDFFCVNHKELKLISGRRKSHLYAEQATLGVAQDCKSIETIRKNKEYQKTSDYFYRLFNKDTIISDNAILDTRCINISTDYPTIEFRMFQSTTDPIVFFGNIEFIHSLYDYFAVSKYGKVDNCLEFSNYIEFLKDRPSKYPNLIHSLIELKLFKKKRLQQQPNEYIDEKV